MSREDMVPDNALLHRLNHLKAGLAQVQSLADTRPQFGDIDFGLVDGALKALYDAMAEKAHPDDEVNAKYRSRMRSESIRVHPSGTEFWPLDPRPEEVYLEDIAWGLTYGCPRYLGHTTRVVSVIEHSIKVGAVAEHLASELVRAGKLRAHLVELAALAGLLHDAHEAYVGDTPSPIKRVMMSVYGRSWDLVEDRIQEVIEEALGIPVLPQEIIDVVKQADKLMLYAETVAVRPNSDSSRYGDHPSPDLWALAKMSNGPADLEALRKLWIAEAKRLLQRLGGRVPRPPKLGDMHETETAHRVIEPLPVNPDPVVTQVREAQRSGASWMQEVRSADVYVPPQLLDEPEFSGDD